MKLPWTRCYDAAVAALKAYGIEPCDLARFTAYDVPAYAPRRPSTTWNPPEYLDWWPKAERAVVEAEIQTDRFWLDHGFRAYSTNHYVIRVLYEHGKRADVVVGIWLAAALRLVVRRRKPQPGKPLQNGVLPIARGIAAAAEHHLWRLRVWSPWPGDAAYVLPDQPEGFLVGVEPTLEAVTEAIVEKVAGIHEKYMLVAMYPKGPIIPNARAEQAAAKALVELTDEQFMRVVRAEADRRRGRGEPN
ncbi:MAG: hypothetical protein MUF54_14100 [Polyangiaceae bacterium]|jgi:hypothetical protein|nr:hypothetical protein [Polyangiaceae bacterium]